MCQIYLFAVIELEPVLVHLAMDVLDVGQLLLFDQGGEHQLLEADNSTTIHQKNLQFLAIEIYKVKMELSPIIMK